MITHGTDTMVETAQMLQANVSRKDNRADRRNDSLQIREFRWTVQSRKRAGVRSDAPAWSLYRDERAIFPTDRVRKNKSAGIFEHI